MNDKQSNLKSSTAMGRCGWFGSFGFKVRLSILVFLLSSIASAQEGGNEDREMVIQYLNEASKLTENVAYRFDGQAAASYDGNAPSLKLFRGMVIRSKDKDFEYYSLVTSQVPTVEENVSLDLLVYKELLRIGAKRFRKNYAMPSEPGALKSAGLAGIPVQGPPPELLGLDSSGNPVPSTIPKFCAFGFPFATPAGVFSDREDVNVYLDAYLTKFKFKSSQVVNDKVESYWYGVDKSSVLTVLLDPLLDYRPTEYRCNLIRLGGKVDKSPYYETKTAWAKHKDSGYFPSKIRMVQHSRKVDNEVDVSITWFDQDLWPQIGSKDELRALSEKSGTAWQEYFEEKFSKRLKP